MWPLNSLTHSLTHSLTPPQRNQPQNRLCNIRTTCLNFPFYLDLIFPFNGRSFTLVDSVKHMHSTHSQTPKISPKQSPKKNLQKKISKNLSKKSLPSSLTLSLSTHSLTHSLTRWPQQTALLSISTIPRLPPLHLIGNPRIPIYGYNTPLPYPSLYPLTITHSHIKIYTLPIISTMMYPRIGIHVWLTVRLRGEGGDGMGGRARMAAAALSHASTRPLPVPTNQSNQSPPAAFPFSFFSNSRI